MRGCNQTADASLVVPLRGNLPGDAFAKNFLHFGIARKTETLGKADDGGRLHTASPGHILDTVQSDVSAVFFDIAGDQFELPAKCVELVGDALDQQIGIGLSRDGPGRRWQVRLRHSWHANWFD